MNILDQDNVRRRTVNYISENGIKYYHFAKEVHIPNYVLSKWRKHQKPLWESSLKNIDDYLKQKGY